MKPTSLVLSGWGPYRGVEQADFETIQAGTLVSGLWTDRLRENHDI